MEIIKEMREDKCTIFFGYTSSMVSSGLRDIFRYLAEHKMVDVIVTTAGGIEEDIIKCLGPFLLGDFRLNGKQLRDKGINRIGNILVPNERYIKFEDFLIPILDKIKEPINPSELVKILGKEINEIAMTSKKTGVIILGSGTVKHHIVNANLMRGGSDYAIYINTAQEYDGSDAGALPEEAISWGKIKGDGKSIKVFGDATILFPLIVYECFKK